MVRRIEEVVERHAPGFSQRIVARHVQSPPSMEAADANLVGGDLSGGSAALHQQLVLRPTVGLARPETPVRGLYLASASAASGQRGPRRTGRQRRLRRPGGAPPVVAPGAVGHGLAGQAVGACRSGIAARRTAGLLSRLSDGFGDLAGLDAAGADLDPTCSAVDHGPHSLDVGVPAALGTAMRVTDAHAERRVLAAHLAGRCHRSEPLATPVSPAHHRDRAA